MIQTDLYFGLSLHNGQIIPDSSWSDFVKQEVRQVFLEGFTVIPANGFWMDQQRRQLYTEPSRIISFVGRMTPALSDQINRLREKYKTLFQQDAVLRIDKQARAQF